MSYLDLIYGFDFESKQKSFKNVVSNGNIVQPVIK